MGIHATEFNQLIQRFHAGDSEALAVLYEKYGGVLREAVRRRLPDCLRKEYDSIDFVHDVWASVCRLPPGQKEFATPEHLGGFLTSVARNKVLAVCRHRLATKGFNVTREQPLVQGVDGTRVPIPGREPTPSQWAIADERWAAIAAELPAAHVAIMQRIREGFTQEEIAAVAGVNVRTIQRIVERVRELCEEAP